MTDGHTRPLADLRSADEGSFGAKSTSLGELLAAGIPVPPGFAVATTAFAAFLDEAGDLRGRIDAAMARVLPAEVASVRAAAEAIGTAVRGTPVPDAVREQIAAAYAALAREAGTGDDPPVAVRSSSVGEDSRTATFAGQQDTYLWVRGADAVVEAVRGCWASAYSAPAITYRAHIGDRRAPEVGVAVQIMVDAAVSGVMFTCNPVSGDPSVIAVNASWGLGLAVVGGEVTPDEFFVSRVTREVVRRTISSKHLEYRPADAGHGTMAVPVDEARRDEPCLNDDHLGQLVDVARRVQRHFGGHQDVEWALAPDDTLYVVQSRPVTATAAAQEPASPQVSALTMVLNRFGAGGVGA